MGTLDQKRELCSGVAISFPTVRRVHIRMRSQDPFAENCYFNQKIRTQEQEAEEHALKQRSAQYYVDFTARIIRQSAGDYRFESTIRLMGISSQRWKIR